jgi:hypothetical protein
MFTSASSVPVANLQNATQTVNGNGYATVQPYNVIQNITGSSKVLVTYSSDFVSPHIAGQDDYSLIDSRLSSVLGIQNLLNLTYGGWFGYFQTTAPCVGTWKRAAYVGYNSTHVEVFAFRCEADSVLYAYE